MQREKNRTIMPPGIDEKYFYRQPNPKRLNSSSTFESEVASKIGEPILPMGLEIKVQSNFLYVILLIRGFWRGQNLKL